MPGFFDPMMGVKTKSFTCKLELADHVRLRDYAVSKGQSVTEVVRAWVLEQLKKAGA